MAKNITFSNHNISFEASITKIDRDKIYGYVEEIALDKNGNPCSTGNIMDDGQTLILSGATAMKTIDAEFREQDKKKLKTVYLDGSDAVLVPSVYEKGANLESASHDDLFDLEVSTVYQLVFASESAQAEALQQMGEDKLYKFIFNYRADYEGADAILLCAQKTIFILCGRMIRFDYLENSNFVEMSPVQESEVEEEEIDFGML